MIRQGIALATSAVTLVGMWIIGNKSWRGWALGLANQGLWLLFIVAFGAWGLLPLSAALIVIYTRNLVKWRAESGVLACRSCGCTDARACVGGCYWVEPDLCSACA